MAQDLKVDPDKAVNLFETTIRVVGGLLAAFHLSNGDMVMLYKAASLALRLLPAFGSATGDSSCLHYENTEEAVGTTGECCAQASPFRT